MKTENIVLIATAVIVIGGGLYLYMENQKAKQLQAAYYTPQYAANMGYGIANTTGQQPWYNSTVIANASHDFFNFLGGL